MTLPRCVFQRCLCFAERGTAVDVVASTRRRDCSPLLRSVNAFNLAHISVTHRLIRQGWRVSPGVLPIAAPPSQYRRALDAAFTSRGADIGSPGCPDDQLAQMVGFTQE